MHYFIDTSCAVDPVGYTKPTLCKAFEDIEKEKGVNMAITLDNYKKVRCQDCGFIFEYIEKTKFEDSLIACMSVFQPDKYSLYELKHFCPHCDSEDLTDY